MVTGIDLQSYFERIGYTGPSQPTLAVLTALHAKHPAQIPFEGLDPFLGRPVSIDIQSIQSKLVQQRRGGYCHEQNALFLNVLQAIGFHAEPLAARVVWMSPGRSAPPTHRLTLVHLPQGDYLADVGFGGQTYTSPLRLDDDAPQTTPHGVYRVVRHDGVVETQMRLADGWEGMYRLTLTPAAQGDFEMANWFTATHPKTRFVRNLVAARIVGAFRLNLLNASLSIHGPDGTEHRTLTSPEDLRDVLVNRMGIQLPIGVEDIWQRLPAEAAPLWP
nr:arylamine N-acetyltransferase [uncultured Rhodopila sp.]